MYDYQTERKNLFDDDGQRMLLKFRDWSKMALKTSGAFTMEAALNGTKATGSSWTMMACIDRLVELGEIREVAAASGRGQDRIFVATR